MRTPLPSLWILSSRRSAFWFGASLLVGCLTAAAEPVVVPMQENDTIAFQPAGNNRARVELTLARSPTTSNDATLKVANRDDYIFWSGKLTRQGDRWITQVDRDALQAILMVHRIIAEFPGAAAEGEALQLVVPRDRLGPALEPLAPLAAGDPLFFEPPSPPEPPEVPSTNVERVRAESFAMSARRWEREQVAYINQFAAARSRAHALFMDLRTAGRLPWPADALAQLEQTYEGLGEQEQSYKQSLSEWRSSAQSFVRQWNQAHGDQPPVELKFAEEAA